MKLHPREIHVREIETKLRRAVADVVHDADLTSAEYVRVLVAVFGDELGCLAKHLIRAERHPDDPERPGGIE